MVAAYTIPDHIRPLTYSIQYLIFCLSPSWHLRPSTFSSLPFLVWAYHPPYHYLCQLLHQFANYENHSPNVYQRRTITDISSRPLAINSCSVLRTNLSRRTWKVLTMASFLYGCLYLYAVEKGALDRNCVLLVVGCRQSESVVKENRMARVEIWMAEGCEL